MDPLNSHHLSLSARIGRGISVIVAVTLAIYLVLQEQVNHNHLSGQTLQEAYSTLTNGIDHAPRAENLVRSLVINDRYNSREINVASAGSYEFGNLMSRVGNSRLDSVFFATSKAGPPPGVGQTFILQVNKASQVEKINLSMIEKRAWKDLEEKIEKFHRVKTSDVTKIALVEHPEDLRTYTPKRLAALLVAIEATQRAQAPAQQTAQQAAPNPALTTAPAKYTLHVSRRDQQMKTVALHELNSSQWKIYRQLIIDYVQPQVYMDYRKAGERKVAEDDMRLRNTPNRPRIPRREIRRKPTKGPSKNKRIKVPKGLLAPPKLNKR